MISFRKLTSGVTQIIYGRTSHVNDIELTELQPSDEARRVISEAIQTFNYLLPIDQRLTAFQFSQLIKLNTDEPQSVELADRLHNIKMVGVFLA